MSELLYAGKTLSEIAGMDDCQLRYVVGRSRDGTGRLIRRSEELPPWVMVDSNGMRRIGGGKISFKEAYLKAKMSQGQGKDEAERSWMDFKLGNPRVGRGGR